MKVLETGLVREGWPNTQLVMYSKTTLITIQSSLLFRQLNLDKLIEMSGWIAISLIVSGIL